MTPCTRLFSAVALLLAAAAIAPAQAPKQPPSLDDELLKELGADPLDDVDRQLFGPAPQQPDNKQPPGPTDDLQERLARELGAAGASEDENPMLAIANRMRDVGVLIAGNNSGENTQQVQKQIVSALDKLIAQARKNCRKAGGGTPQPQTTAARKPVAQPGSKPPGAGQGKPGSKPATNSNAKPGQGEAAKPDVQQIRAMIEKDIWGTLPERQRQQLLQLPMEEFLPQYELLIIEYFKRLSEGNTKRPGSPKP